MVPVERCPWDCHWPHVWFEDGVPRVCPWRRRRSWWRWIRENVR